jgi:hypothetical protein
MVFLMLNMYGNGMNISRFLANILARLYAGASFQLSLGQIVESALCILMKPLIMGEEGFKFIYFHLSVLYGDIH